MNPRVKIVLYAAGSFLAFISFLVALIVFAPALLLSGDEPKKSDAIIVLAGEPLRALYAADLYNKGFSPKVYISLPAREHTMLVLDSIGIVLPRQEEIYRQVLLKKGVPDKDIYFFGNSSISTADEADALGLVFNGGTCKLLIVTSSFHARRAKMIFQDVLKRCDIGVVGTPYEPFPRRWWTDQNSARNVLLEIFKIIFYKIGGRFSSK